MAKIFRLSDPQDVKELERARRFLHEYDFVLCHGVFDLLHPGHLAYLQDAKNYGDMLVVSITNDEFVRSQRGPGKPIYNENIRAEMLAALKIVDWVIINNTDRADSVIPLVKPKYLVKGDEYRETLASNKPLLAEKECVEKYGGELVFAATPKMSSTKILNDSFPIYSEATKEFLTKFKKKHSREEMLKCLDAMQWIKLLIIGDSILDVHVYVDLMDKAPKTGILAMGYKDHEIMYGATNLMAKIAAQLAESVDLVSIVGNKPVPAVIPFSNFTLLQQDLSRLPNVKSRIVVDDNREPTIKVRYREMVFEELKHRTTIAEIVHQPTAFPEKEILQQAMEIDYTQYDAVICMDYGQYMIPKEWASDISYSSRFFCLSCQSNESNYGFNSIFRYPQANMLCVDDVELRLAFSDKDTCIPVLMEGARRQLKSKFMVLTQGRLGCQVLVDAPGDHLKNVPVLGSGEIVDRIGAGDSFIVLSTLAAQVTDDPEVIGFFGNMAGYLKCLNEGTDKAITKDEMVLFIKRLMT